MLEVALDSLGLPLNAAEVPGGGLHKLQLGTRRGQLRDGLLQVRVGHLVGVELGFMAEAILFLADQTQLAARTAGDPAVGILWCICIPRIHKYIGGYQWCNRLQSTTPHVSVFCDDCSAADR